MLKLQTYLKGDLTIWVVLILLSLASLLFVYGSISPLAFRYSGGNTLQYLFKQGFMLSIGMFMVYWVHNRNFKIFAKFAEVLYWVSVALLLFTLLKGTNINNANRWLTIPIINQNFQTSDLAKISLIIYVARYLSQHKDNLNKFNTGVLPVLLRVGLMCALILPANFSTAALLFAVCFIMLFVGKIPIMHLLGVVALGVVALGMMIGIASVKPDLLPRATTWKNRILNHQSGSEKENFQVIQAKYAIASGGVLPNGPGKGNSRNYLPHPYSDMIYAFIIEEYGSILGGVGLVLAYLTLFSRALRIAIRSNSHFGAYLVVGLSVSLMLQALINMMVAVNIIPVTGQPLPLLSMGGTSTVFTCIAFGMILCVGRATQNETKGGNHAIA